MKNKKVLIAAGATFVAIDLLASFGPLSPGAEPYEREYIWPEGRMPDVQEHQIAAKLQDVGKPGFYHCCDKERLQPSIDRFVNAGFTVANLTYRTPRPKVQCDLHTLATRPHCFQESAAPGTGSYTWLDRIWEFMKGLGL